MARIFPKCLICGTHGHVERHCPVRALNARQEYQQRIDQENIRLGLTPALEAEIAAIRRNWLNRASA
jgi:hypothetical protein